MSPAPDLARWNRAGLSRFRYLDANAAGHLEELRRVLIARFPEWTDLGGSPPAGEPDAARLARLLAQYFEEEPQGGTAGGRTREAVIRLRRDPAWQIARAAARAVHVLGEHLDAYANEGFLKTAAEREHLRRLTALLDFHPAPPASATTVLVLTAKGAGRVEAGFPVQHVPADGGPPVVFETREEVEIDPALNAVRLAGWNRSEEELGTATDPRTSPWIAPGKSEIATGQLGLLVRELAPPEEAAAVSTIGRVDPATRRFALEPAGSPSTSPWKKGETRLLARAQRIVRPRLNGPGVVPLAAPHDLAVGDVVAWLTGSVWHFAAVLEAGERAVRLPAADLPAPGTEVLRSVPARRSPDEIFLPLQFLAAAKPTPAGTLVLLDVDDKVRFPTDGTQTHWRIKPPEIAVVHFVPAVPRVVGKVVAAVADEFLFDGKPGELAAGQWTVGDDDGGFHALRIARIREREDHFAVTFGTPLPRLVRLHALFAETLRPEGHDRNAKPVEGTELALDLPSLGGALPTLLARGRELVLEREEGEGFAGARRARVLAVEAGAAPPKLTVAPRIDIAEGFTFGATVLRANLAAAGHGEAKPEKVLGSGDATRGGQTFVLEEPDVSFVADATQPTGVRADVLVQVEEAIWEQVASLRESRPTDPHYTVRQTEEGHLAFGFGDGRNGRRLPAGADNVRVRFRAGAGLAGNLPPGSLAAPKRPHRLVDAVRQPLAATGGNDREPLESLRANAPASVLTLERAVSVADLTHLASRQASVWQARAFPAATGPRLQASIEVVVVPAGGGPLGELAVTLRNALEAHAPPGVAITVAGFDSQPFALAVTVQVVTSRFNPDEVEERVRTALLDAFFLRRRGLGQDLFLSEVVRVVEPVLGVENSVSVLNDTAGLRRLAASERQVYHLVPASLRVEVREHEL